MLKDLGLDFLELLPCVCVLHVAHSDAQPLRVEVVVEVVERGVGENIGKVDAHQPASLVAPAPRN